MDPMAQADNAFVNTGQKLTAESFTASFMSSTMSDLTAPSEMDFYRRASYLEEYGMQRARELELAERRRREQGACKSVITACQCIPQPMQTSTSTAAYGDMRLQASPFSQGPSRRRSDSVKKKRTRWPSPKKILNRLICGSDPMTSSIVGEDTPFMCDFSATDGSRPSTLYIAPEDLERLLKPAGSLISKYDELDQAGTSKQRTRKPSDVQTTDRQNGLSDGIPETQWPRISPNLLRRYISRSEPINPTNQLPRGESVKWRPTSITQEMVADNGSSVTRALRQTNAQRVPAVKSNKDPFPVTSV